jgi:hypothetical protein
MVEMVTRGIMGTAKQGSKEETKDATFDEEWGGIFTEKRSKWSEQRAVIVKKPTEPIVAEIGKIVFVPIEVLNQTKWPWKQGCSLLPSPKQSAAL